MSIDMGHVMAENGIFGPGFLPSNYQSCRNCGDRIHRTFYGGEWKHSDGYVECDLWIPVAEPERA